MDREDQTVNPPELAMTSQSMYLNHLDLRSATPGQSSRYDLEQEPWRERLQHHGHSIRQQDLVVGRSAVDGASDVDEPRDKMRPSTRDLPVEGDARDGGYGQVAQDEIEPGPIKAGQRFGAAAEAIHLVPIRRKDIDDKGPNLLVRFHDKDARHLSLLVWVRCVVGPYHTPEPTLSRRLRQMQRVMKSGEAEPPGDRPFRLTYPVECRTWL